MIIGVCKETFPGERRVVLIPDVVRGVTKLGLDVLVERGAGAGACISDAAYEEVGARLADRAKEAESVDERQADELYTKALHEFDLADALVQDLARSYKIEVTRRRIALLI